MKRLVLFVVALVFAFCTTVMADGVRAGGMKTPEAPPETTPLFGKTAPVKAEKVKKHHKHHKEKKEGKEKAPANAPAK
ncbi:MAG: hypothetical protein ABSF13_10000 [Smithella sp.]|jgi:hypothetical protein